MTFTQPSRGDTHWKNVPEAFTKHTLSNTHAEAVEKLITLPATTKDVGELLSATDAKEKEESRKHFMQIISPLKYLARQNLAMRGADTKEDSTLVQLMKLLLKKTLPCRPG